MMIIDGSGNASKPSEMSPAGAAPVPAPDFSRIRPDDFADEDYISPQVWLNDRRGIPYYFKHFHTVANAVRLEGPHRGFVDIAVHRSPEHNYPYNARVQENHLWFAYFYTNPSSWNLYYGMPQVQYRLEAVLEHLLTLQGPEGAFSEYSPGGYNLPGTSFALQFLGQTVRLLEEAKESNPDFPFINENLYTKVLDASRKAIEHVLHDSAHWKHGTGFTNQYTLMWSATAAYLAFRPDGAIESKLRERMTESASAFISPAGFYYENHAFDMNYNMGVHIQNMMADYYYFKDTPLEQEMIEKESRFIEWLSYNLVREPDGSFFTSNAAVSGRTESAHYERKDIPLAEKLPLARAFVKSQEEVALEIQQAKSEIVKDGSWPNVPELQRKGGSAFNPYGLYNRILYRYYPTEAERAEAIAKLPYLASESFNHHRSDDRSGLQFTYVRRPDYYAAFNAGPCKVNAQVFGIGLLWHPRAGIILSSQTEAASMKAGRGLSWGTKHHNSPRVYENGDVCPRYYVDGQEVMPIWGCSDIASGDIAMRYELGTEGQKTVHFGEESISVTVRHPNRFEEYLPLMAAPGDQIDLEQGSIVLNRGDTNIRITFDEGAEAELVPRSFHMYSYQMQMLILKASQTLQYTIKMGSR
ncbi:hypothetical protein RAC89_25020 [Paenibacillus sp. GD4]|uniref:hypothetical protein n=1 Tax=Paenibacillus sp. GD4 TaxID=3068890 RepID=UPI00279655A6|nr:hypothetical protein [Paenibacillus sp. GD4]MDQ1913668.1 hypothetical protein [Paenibacillus sp. GD4]